jgi:murein tripeptide amidase MpaA
MAYQLIKGYRKKDVFITDIIDQYDFYIMPVVNPDGKLSLCI